MQCSHLWTCLTFLNHIFFFKGFVFFRVLRGTSVATTKWQSRNQGTLSNQRHWRCTTPWRGHFTPSVVLKAEAMKPWSRARKFRRSKQHEQNKISMRYFTLDLKKHWHKRNFRDPRQGLKLGIAEDQIPSIRDSKHQIAKSFRAFEPEHSSKSFKCLYENVQLYSTYITIRLTIYRLHRSR